MSYKIFDGNYITNEFDAELDEQFLDEEFDDTEEEDYSDNEDDENDYEEDGEYPSFESEEVVYHDGEIYEAKIRLNAKEKKKRDAMSQLMTALNKEPDYQAARDKFVKVYKMLAKKKITELGLKIKPTAIEKVTISDLNK